MIIPDDNLRAIVERTIGKAPGEYILRRDVQELITLNAGYSQIQDLSGLEHFIRLRTLNLSNNLIRDLTPLAGLTKLRESRSGEQPRQRTAAPLRGLTRLEALSLVNSDLTDAAPLAGLTRLKHLTLYANHLESARAAGRSHQPRDPGRLVQRHRRSGTAGGTHEPPHAQHAQELRDGHLAAGPGSPACAL